MEDCKLQAVKTGSGHLANVYGSEEDDTSASKSLLEIGTTKDQTTEFFVSEVLKCLENFSEVNLLYKLFKHLRLLSLIKELIFLLYSALK